MSSGDLKTRNRILVSTVALLQAQGGRGVRMSDIAKGAGISRQAVYLHFPSRAELLIAATRHVDQVLEVDRRLGPSRAAKSGIERMALYIEFWGHYVPEIYPVAKALILAQDGDKAAAAAWIDRMSAMREGCRAAIDALDSDGNLSSEWTPSRATEMFWTMLSVPNWEILTIQCGWSVEQYIHWLKILSQRTFVEK